jgi:hypothetical protein
MLTDGRPLRFLLAAGQSHDILAALWVDRSRHSRQVPNCMGRDAPTVFAEADDRQG